MSPFRNIHACLVHEGQECVVDLVRNLRCLDPDSTVILYNGGRDPALLNHGFPFDEYGAVVHPHPQPLSWGRLHDFALDCMRFAIDHFSFDTLTIVDSDQLAARRGYSAYLSQFFAANPRVGLAGNSSVVQPRTTRVGPVIAAYKELDLWRPFLSRFNKGIEQYGHWCFWPSTVFSEQAARDLTHLFATDQQLQDIMSRSKIWASEEVVFPTLAAVLGYQVADNPCSYEYVRHRVAYSTRDVDRALARSPVYWLHPINRRYDDPLRAHVRHRFNHYERPPRSGGSMSVESSDHASARPLFLTMPILSRMRAIEGWLEDDEADLLIAATARAIGDLPPPHAIVEVGSYCGRSTVVFGGVVQTLGAEAKVYAIDPHDGVVGALDRGLKSGPSTLQRFARNIEEAGLQDIVVNVQQRSFDVAWNRSISLLFIDGLHDYANVARDFFHFDVHVAPGGYVAFHDYADYYPGVKAFVNELLATPGYELVHAVRSMMLLRKRDGARMDAACARGDTSDAGATDDAAACAVNGHDSAPRIAVGAEPLVTCIMPTARRPGEDERFGTGHGIRARPDRPMVSCLMPTFNRRLFVPQALRCFAAQEYAAKELIVVDDGDERVEQAITNEGSIRYVSVDRRMSLGEKRNLAASLARGEILAHWDDDDWYGSRYLTELVKALCRDGDGTLSGLSRYLVYLLPTASLKICASRGPAGATFCYWKSIWARHPYRDTNRAEDYFFLEDARPRVRSLQMPELFAVVRHRHHTWASEHGRDVTRRLSTLPPYRRPFGAIVGREAAAFYEHARRVLFQEPVPAGSGGS